MPSFKQAAYEVLKEARKPLTSGEITRLAIDKNLIKTSGATPQRTMYTELYRDIRKNGRKSVFMKHDRGFSINPNY